MTGPVNAVVGDEDSPTKLPETEVPKEILVEEKKLAKYSETAEFKRLREFMEARIQFYQRYLPSGEHIEGNSIQPGLPEGVSIQDLGAYWKAACIVIKEFENVLGEYDRAREVVKDAGPKNA